jgi:hypothetical protein
MAGILDRQLLGLRDTLILTAVLAGYILLIAIPPFILGRRTYYHPIWRGIESFACYAAIALVLGGVLDIAQEGDWSVLSGISVGGAIWARIGSVAVLAAVFVAASWWGGKTAPERRRRVRSRGSDKNKAS